MDPQQELFTQLLSNIKALRYDVYDGFLPPKGTPYPFVYLGDCRQDGTDTKTQTIGTVYQTIHVWHNTPEQRGTVSQMLLAIKNVCRNIGRTNNFKWDVRNVEQRIFSDNTTKTALLHGVLEVDFKFS